MPDALTKTALVEIKDVSKLGLTDQLKDFAEFAKETGREFILIVREDTNIGRELQELANQGLVRIERVKPQ